MVPSTPDSQPKQPTTAVVQVAQDGTAKLYLGTELVEHANGVDAPTIMRILVDYAATIDAGVRLTTQMPDGTWTRHRLHPEGTLTSLPRNLPAASTVMSSVGSAEAPRLQRRAWPRITTQGWLPAMLILLVAAAMVTVMTGI